MTPACSPRHPACTTANREDDASTSSNGHAVGDEYREGEVLDS